MRMHEHRQINAAPARRPAPASGAVLREMHEPVATLDGVADRSHGRFRRELAIVQDVRPAAERLADLAKHGDRLRRLPLIGDQAGCCRAVRYSLTENVLAWVQRMWWTRAFSSRNGRTNSCALRCLQCPFDAIATQSKPERRKPSAVCCSNHPDTAK